MTTPFDHAHFLLQGVMVRLMLVLAPVMCILSGIGISSILAVYMKVGVASGWVWSHVINHPIEC